MRASQPSLLGLSPHAPCRPGRDADRLFDLVPANTPERQAGAELLERALLPGQIVITDKGFAGREFEELVASLGGVLVRPDRKDEQPRLGSLGRARQWVESAFDTLKGQLSLERHGARTLAGVIARVLQRLLALAVAVWHNHLSGQPGRSLVAYDH